MICPVRFLRDICRTRVDVPRPVAPWRQAAGRPNGAGRWVRVTLCRTPD